MEIAGGKPPGGSRRDGEVIACDAGRPRPAAGYGLARHHGLEVILTGPPSVPGPPGFQDPFFRPPAPEETARLTCGPGDEAPLVVASEADAGGPAAVPCRAAAEGPGVRPGFVPGRPRAGERTAPGTRDWPGPPLPTD
ncbi:hypothetical protein HCJ76_13890 [Streptomyces sp. MC1]|uniref:hypothetical protein n=1 Tax=Streptomyces sp. MC1 TaxID=295105 RepID=UPI0018C9FD3B|nr:hypothetical protein [Streptomyces sp. MC1]MBG7699142.1 hypothetical protein [Streptomyces sp. MC1]